MRKALVALSLGAFVMGAIAPMTEASAAGPKMSKMGCVVGKQRWDATVGKCVDGKPVAKAKKAKTKAVPKAAPKKPLAKKPAPKKAPEKKAS